MVTLYIIGGVLVFIALLLLLPITARVKFENNLFLKIKFLGITLYELKQEENPKTEKSEKNDEKPQQKTAEEKGIFTKLKEKHGFIGALKELFGLANDIITATKPQLLKIKFRKVKVNLTVVGSDAAMTAIEYGTACSVVYPVLSFIDQSLNVKFKQINVEAGFKKEESEFSASLDVKANAVLLLIIAFKALKEYKNFSVRNEL